MTPPDTSGRPLVDPTVLDRLRGDLEEDDETCRTFVGNYVNCLPQRVQRLQLALSTGDFEASMDAVLSLRTSSQMVGAEQLANLAKALEGRLRTELPAADPAVVLPGLAESFLLPISQCSRQTIYGLRDQCPPGASR